MKKLLIYGATGYTGSMVAHQAKAAGLNFVAAGPGRLDFGDGLVQCAPLSSGDLAAAWHRQAFATSRCS
jgi:nucleoside-diphosphate-sugar epimerase